MIRFYRWLLVFIICATSAWGANPFASDSNVEAFDSAPLISENVESQSAKPAKRLEVPNNTLAVMADLHTRPGNVEMIKKAFSRINSLKNIYGLVLAGDLCSKVGSPSEYELLESATKKLDAPIFAVPGNHDLIYKDELFDGNKKRATQAERKEKQGRFKNLFGLKSLCYSRKVAGHLLIFLPNDSLSGTPLVLPSDNAYEFLRKTLKKNQNTPTIVFCHAPLAGSYGDKKTLAPIHANLQPAAKIKKILKENPQVYLWFAGHLHITPGQEFYNFKGNRVGNVNVIHVPPVKNDRAWVQTLRLLPNGALVRTMDVKTGKFLKKHNRVFAHHLKLVDEASEEQKNQKSEKNEKTEQKKARIVVTNAHGGSNFNRSGFGDWLADLEPDVSLVSEAKNMRPYISDAGRVFNAGSETKGQIEVAAVVRHGLAVTDHDCGKISPDLGIGIAHDRWFTMVQTKIAGVKTRVYSLHLNAVTQQPDGKARPVHRWEVTREGLEKLEKIWEKDKKQGWAVIVGGDLNWNNSRKLAKSNPMAPGRVFDRLNMKVVNHELMWLAWTPENHKLVKADTIPPTKIPGLVPREHLALNILLESRKTNKEKDKSKDKDKDKDEKSDENGLTNPEKSEEEVDLEQDKEEEQLIESEEESDLEDFIEVDAEISELEDENADTLEILINTLEDDYATGTVEL